MTEHDAKGLEIIAGWLQRDGLTEPAAMLRRLAAGASEGQADTYDVRVAFEEIARAISEHEPLDRRVAVSMRALNRWHQALAKFLYATPPGAAAEIAALREQIAKSAKIIASLSERIAGMEKEAQDAKRYRTAKQYGYVSDNEELRIDSYIAKEKQQ